MNPAVKHKQLADLPFLIMLFIHQNGLLVLHLPQTTVTFPFIYLFPCLCSLKGGDWIMAEVKCLSYHAENCSTYRWKGFVCVRGESWRLWGCRKEGYHQAAVQRVAACLPTLAAWIFRLRLVAQCEEQSSGYKRWNHLVSLRFKFNCNLVALFSSFFFNPFDWLEEKTVSSNCCKVLRIVYSNCRIFRPLCFTSKHKYTKT